MKSAARRTLHAILPPRVRWVIRELLSAETPATISTAWRVPVRFRGATLADAGRRDIPPVPDTFNAFLPTPLCALMRREGSDKGMGWHNYTTFYHALFSARRGTVRRVFEMGLGTTDLSIPSSMGTTGIPGASLRGWRSYFPNARVFGADIDSRTLFREDRIDTYACDQTDPDALRRLWNGHPELSEPFDLIVDDGLHEPDANRCFFEHSGDRLAIGGFFVIEDVTSEALSGWESGRIGRLLEQFPGFRFAVLRIPHRANRADNNLVVGQRMR